MAKVLIVDDEKNIVNTLKAILQDEGHSVAAVLNGDDALKHVKANDLDAVFLDVWLPDIDGLEVLNRIKQIQKDAAVIMISGHGSIDIAVKATRLGAYDFLEKPPSIERVITSLNNALEQLQLKRENILLKKNIMEDEMIGASSAMQEVKRIIDTAGSTNARVFITGDNGTGKELVARAIYRKSKRSDKPFIKVNCAAIPDELIESELFGHEKGSFTGAHSRRLGKFELADKGTLFLDEICDMSQSAQAKVLRVLQEQQFERVGGNDVITVDVRIIAATNVDVHEAIEQGRFREDLYYRLNVIPIYVPPLTGRTEDVPLLVDYFLDKFAREHGFGVKQMNSSAMDFLKNYAWTGNVRELKNVIERLTIMVPNDSIQLEDITKNIQSYDYEDTLTREASGLKKAREQFEKDYIIKTLKQYDKNVSATAKALGIERTNLHRKIRQYHININKL